MKGRSSILPDIARVAEVLVIRLRLLGDIVLLAPVISSLKRWRPGLCLNVMAEKPFALMSGARVFVGNDSGEK